MALGAVWTLYLILTINSVKHRVGPHAAMIYAVVATAGITAVIVLWATGRFKSDEFFITVTTAQSLPRKLTFPKATLSELREPSLRGKAIYLHRFHEANATREIKDRTFEDCAIVGPGVMFADEGAFLGNMFFPNWGTMFWGIQRPDVAVQFPAGTFYLKRAVFRRCVFVDITLVGDQKFLEEVKAQTPDLR